MVAGTSRLSWDLTANWLYALRTHPTFSPKVALDPTNEAGLNAQ